VARIACESVARELTAEEKAPALEIGFDLLQSIVFVLLNPSGGRRRILLNWVDERRRRS
jgi:hypothetical protein